MAWRITDGPDPASRASVDATGWRWQIERAEGENRRLLIEVSGSAMAVDPRTLPDDARNARETEGRSAVEGILERDDPPGRISFSTHGREETAYGGMR